METVLYNLHQLGQMFDSDVHPSGCKVCDRFQWYALLKVKVPMMLCCCVTTGRTANTINCSCCRVTNDTL